MRIAIKVIAGAKKTEDRGVMADGTRKIAVAAVREDGKANEALRAFLAKQNGCKKSDVRIVHGEKSTRKIVEIVLRVVAP